jgi:hypothetical protein
MSVFSPAPTGRKIIAQGKAQRRPRLAVQNIFPALKGRQKSCAGKSVCRNSRPAADAGRHCASQLVTNCNQLKTARRRKSQPVTICYQLKFPIFAPWRLCVNPFAP